MIVPDDPMLDRLLAPLSPATVIRARLGDTSLHARQLPDRALVVCDGDLALVRRSGLLACLSWLRDVRRPVAVLATTAPVHDRAATLLPPDTWRALFRAAGLRVLGEAVDSSGSKEGGWATAWDRVDPWRTPGVHACAFLLAPEDEPTAEVSLPDAVRRLAGPQHRPRRAGCRIGFLVSGYQDFHTLASWIDRLDVRDVVVLLRDAAFGASESVVADLRAACAAFEAPVATLGADLAATLRDVSIDALVSASESPANVAHLGNAAVLIVARSLGIPTAHAQHGIWPRAEFPLPISTVADHVLAWSDEYREVVHGSGPVHVVGAPRFDRYADTVHRSVTGLYGTWARTCERHVVLATNMHWGQHADAVDAQELVATLAGRFPRTLFTVKPHPYEPSPPTAGMPANVIVLSQPVMLAAGLEPADLVESADVVVTTPSTFGLEATLAAKPCLVIATGNPNRHDFVADQPLASVAAWLEAPAVHPDAVQYARRYCAPDTRGTALDRCLAVLANGTSQASPVPPGVAEVVAGLYAASHGPGSENSHLRASLEEASAYVESLVWTLKRKDAYIESLHRTRGIGPVEDEPARG